MGVSEHVVYPQMTNHPHCIFFAILLCLYTTYSLPIHSILHNLYLYIIHIYIYTLYISISIHYTYLYLYILYISISIYYTYIIDDTVYTSLVNDGALKSSKYVTWAPRGWNDLTCGWKSGPFPWRKRGPIYEWLWISATGTPPSQTELYISLSLSIHIYICGKNYNDLTATEPWNHG